MPAPKKPRSPETYLHAEVGERLALVREALGLRAIDICRELNVGENTYSQWESGRSRPNLDDAIRFCRRYGVTLDWLFLGDISGVNFSLAQNILAASARRGREPDPSSYAAA